MSTAGPRPTDPPPRRVALVVNPATRGDAGGIVAAIRADAPAGTLIEALFTSAPGEATRLAQEAAAWAEVVVAVGGDGTVADVATGIVGRGVPLGIVPAGSTNIVAAELGIPGRPAAAARVLFGPHRLAALDVGRCNDRYFLHMAGAGLDSRFFQRTNPSLKRRVGWLAYLPAAAGALRLPPSRFEIVADGQRLSVTSPLVLVANGGSIISPMLRLLPDVRHDDGWLDLLVFSATTPPEIALTLGQVVTRRLDRSAFLVRIRARQIAIAAEPRLPIELDGDVIGELPAVIGLKRAALRVLAPQ